jgi:hypothetical protein
MAERAGVEEPEEHQRELTCTERNLTGGRRMSAARFDPVLNPTRLYLGAEFQIATDKNSCIMAATSAI